MIQGGAQRAEVGKDGDLLVVCPCFSRTGCVHSKFPLPYYLSPARVFKGWWDLYRGRYSLP